MVRLLLLLAVLLLSCCGRLTLQPVCTAAVLAHVEIRLGEQQHVVQRRRAVGKQ